MVTPDDGNLAALRRYEREQAEGERLLELAEATRAQLVADYIADEAGKHELTLLDYLADLAGGDPEFLHALQRGDAKRMQQLFRDVIDRYLGDELVEECAQRMERDEP
jgi:hypothetical protein